MQAWILAALAALQTQAPGPQVMIVKSWGFNQVDPQTGTILKTVPIVHPTLDVWGLTYDGSQLLAVDRGPAGLALDQIVAVHPSDGGVVSHGLTGYVWNSPAIEIDPTSGILWASYNGDLFTVDASTGAAQLVGPIQGFKPFDSIWSMAIDPQGQAYGFGGIGGSLYSLDLPNATATHLGDLPLPTGFVSDAAFDSAGQLFATLRSSQLHVSGVYEVDIANLDVAILVPSLLASGLAFVPATAETPYCTPKTNALGCDPVLSSLGLASPTASSGYEVTATNVANQTNGRLIYSLVGGASNPFAGGTWCVAAPWTGSPIVSSGGTSKPTLDCSGSWAADVNTLLSQKPGPQPGDTIYCQWIGRDRGFAAPDNYALTSALEFTLLP